MTGNPEGEGHREQDQTQPGHRATYDEDDQMPDQLRQIVLELEPQEAQLLIEELGQLAEQILDQAGRGERAMKARGLIRRISSTAVVALVSAWLRPSEASERPLRIIGIMIFCSPRVCPPGAWPSVPWVIPSDRPPTGTG